MAVSSARKQRTREMRGTCHLSQASADAGRDKDGEGCLVPGRMTRRHGERMVVKSKSSIHDHSPKIMIEYALMWNWVVFPGQLTEKNIEHWVCI